MAKTTKPNQAISSALLQLKQEHDRLSKELARVDEALSALGGLRTGQGFGAPAGRKAAAVRSKRKVSAAARKKMSEAAKARWAARKKEKPATK